MTEARVSRAGGCLCGAIRFEVRGAPIIVAHCHCEDCQHITGSGHSTGAMFSAEGFEMSGEVREFELRSENGNVVTRTFCPECGSPLFGRNSGMVGFLTILLGAFDDSAAFEPSVVVFARSRNPWDRVDDGLETFEAQPVFNPG